MVRKFEAKPIRAFLTTGTHDMENCAGDWFLLDQEMDKALKFSGYDYQFRAVEGKHVAGYMDNFQEAMAYLWKDWPQPVKAGPSAPRAAGCAAARRTMATSRRRLPGRARTGLQCAGRGLLCRYGDTNKIHRIDPDGKVSEFPGRCGTREQPDDRRGRQALHRLNANGKDREL